MEGLRNTMKRTFVNEYNTVPNYVRTIIPGSKTGTNILQGMANIAENSRVIPSFVSTNLRKAHMASVVKRMVNTVKEKKGGKKSKKQNSYTKKTKKQNKYTKKEKRKINGVIKVIYTKKKSRKLYVKSKGKMINLKKYKK
tara:strand:+ start:220 stop:639 length:420 start_codon:yes stop_codon:yes gene_type:complete